MYPKASGRVGRPVPPPPLKVFMNKKKQKKTITQQKRGARQLQVITIESPRAKLVSERSSSPPPPPPRYCKSDPRTKGDNCSP